ncbi:LysR family transcriptional regulator [Kushneria sp. Sum13]|uniref:LysR family transcriptional regulator n=1 Tax=Kushneria sp. Sum13 TaxID=3459196 RepID=UPI0040465E82
MFDWEDLRYFSAFARAGSLSAAAKALRVEHATVARRIASLEEALNLKLVDRRPRAYLLTEDGVKVAGFAEQMSQSSFALERFADAGQGQVQGEVIVSAPPALTSILLAPHVGGLYNQYPDLQLRLVGTKARASLARREADIAIGFERPTAPTLIARRLGKLHFTLYTASRYSRRGNQHVFIGYDESMADSMQQRWLHDQADGRPIVMCSNDLRIQAIAAAGGAGVVLLPEFLAAEHDLVPLDPQGPFLMMDLWLTAHEDVRETARIRAVMDFIVHCTAEIATAD